MDEKESTLKSFLEIIWHKCEGDIEQKVSMYDAGEPLGYSKNEAGSLAEELMVQGMLELKTLAGEVSLTTEGLAFLGLSLPQSQKSTAQQKLGKQSVLAKADLSLVADLTAEIKKQVVTNALDYQVIEEIVVDLKTIEVQLLSPRPKTEIVREILRSLQKSLGENSLSETADTIAACLG